MDPVFVVSFCLIAVVTLVYYAHRTSAAGHYSTGVALLGLTAEVLLFGTIFVVWYYRTRGYRRKRHVKPTTSTPENGEMQAKPRRTSIQKGKAVLLVCVCFVAVAAPAYYSQSYFELHDDDTGTGLLRLSAVALFCSIVILFWYSVRQWSKGRKNLGSLMAALVSGEAHKRHRRNRFDRVAEAVFLVALYLLTLGTLLYFILASYSDELNATWAILAIVCSVVFIFGGGIIFWYLRTRLR